MESKVTIQRRRFLTRFLMAMGFPLVPVLAKALSAKECPTELPASIATEEMHLPLDMIIDNMKVYYIAFGREASHIEIPKTLEKALEGLFRADGVLKPGEKIRDMKTILGMTPIFDAAHYVLRPVPFSW